MSRLCFYRYHQALVYAVLLVEMVALLSMSWLFFLLLLHPSSMAARAIRAPMVMGRLLSVLLVHDMPELILSYGLPVRSKPF